MPDDSEYSVQFCDVEANRDISGDFYAEEDATEIRLWTVDGTCIIAIEKNPRSKMWHVSASDTFNWTTKTRLAFRAWRDAMMLAGPDTAGMIKSAGY